MAQERVDLKRVLMELGNRLVLQHGYKPSFHALDRNVGRVCAAERCTDLIAALTEFINLSADAGDILEDMGIDFPTTPEQQRQRLQHPYMK